MDPRFEQRLRRSRVLGFVVLAAFIAALGWYLWSQRTRSYSLAFSAGSTLAGRNELAKLLAKFAVEQGLTLSLRPLAGSDEVLDDVASGSARLDERTT